LIIRFVLPPAHQITPGQRIGQGQLRLELYHRYPKPIRLGLEGSIFRRAHGQYSVLFLNGDGPSIGRPGDGI
jgi:hypothetical protein